MWLKAFGSRRLRVVSALLLPLALSGCPTDVEEPTIVLSQATVSFTATQDASLPTSATLQISNGQNGTLDELHASVAYQSGASGWLTVSMSSGMAPCALTLTVNSTALDPGSHTATVSVSSAKAMNSPQIVTVQYTVEEAPKPDLTVAYVTAASDTAVLGDSLSIEMEVHNQGAVDAAAFRVGIYYSVDQTITTGDFDCGLQCRWRNGLSAGNSGACAGKIPVPESLPGPGTYYVGAIADQDQEIAESDETNNTAVSDAVVIIEGGSTSGTEIQSGVWAASTGSSTYTFEFTVASDGTGITYLKAIFSGYHCSNWSRSGSIGMGSSWSISGRSFSINRSFQPDPLDSSTKETYKVSGTFDADGVHASGTWSLSLAGGQCTSSGTWTAVPTG
ncbi:MAG: hypothetical protein LJF04_03835 [Gemmatimonadetes bacterium]|nr:hypothetical protein [Gemmatimonadota bacterium]